MAVSAMYAGSAAPGTERKNSTVKGTVVAKLTGASGLDESQPNLIQAGRISADKVFGSKNPWGPEVSWWKKGGRGWLKSDNSPNTTVPSGKGNKGGFGPDHGVPFDEVTFAEYLSTISKDDSQENKEKAAQAAKKTADLQASTKEADDNFHKLHPLSDKSTNVQSITLTKEIAWWPDDKETFYTYRQDGKLSELTGFPIFMHRTMRDYIHGQGLKQTQDEQIEESGDPMIPIELEITIDGIGGIVPGNAFHVDYIPDRYKEFCVFQAIKVDHSVSGGGWTTTIKGLPRVNVKGILKEK